MWDYDLHFVGEETEKLSTLSEAGCCMSGTVAVTPELVPYWC